MKKIAIPLEGGRLCSHFGHCEQFAVIEVDNEKITGTTLLTPPPHEPGLLPRWLAEKGITHIIAGGIGQRALDLFSAQKIEVSIGARPKPAEELVADFLNQKLETGNNLCDH